MLLVSSHERALGHIFVSLPSGNATTTPKARKAPARLNINMVDNTYQSGNGKAVAIWLIQWVLVGLSPHLHFASKAHAR